MLAAMAGQRTKRAPPRVGPRREVAEPAEPPGQGSLFEHFGVEARPQARGPGPVVEGQRCPACAWLVRDDRDAQVCPLCETPLPAEHG